MMFVCFYALLYSLKNSIKYQKGFEKNLLRISLTSPSLDEAILNRKHVNSIPLYHLGKEFEHYGFFITRQNIAHQTILYVERYLSIFYDYLHKKLLYPPVIKMYQTPIPVSKDGRKIVLKAI